MCGSIAKGEGTIEMRLFGGEAKHRWRLVSGYKLVDARTILPNGEYVVESVDIDICKVAPCNILQGTTLNVTTKFTPNTNTGSLPKSLTNDVYIMINNVHIGVTVQPNFCDYSGLCPLRATRLSYTSKITVTADVPPGLLITRSLASLATQSLARSLARLSVWPNPYAEHKTDLATIPNRQTDQGEQESGCLGHFEQT
uniref:(California timema) hypothetical protein n=1 Tax=Timema californicum TaxID=61474 RepID=A0A7R9IX55_TIMCA|nr:unnamed protein product [Timema californicum]